MVASLIGVGKVDPPGWPWQLTQAERATTRIGMSLLEALKRHGSSLLTLAANQASLHGPRRIIEKKDSRLLLSLIVAQNGSGATGSRVPRRARR